MLQTPVFVYGTRIITEELKKSKVNKGTLLGSLVKKYIYSLCHNYVHIICWLSTFRIRIKNLILVTECDKLLEVELE